MTLELAFYFFGGLFFGAWLYLVNSYNKEKHDMHPANKKQAVDAIKAYALIIIIIFWTGYIL